MSNLRSANFEPVTIAVTAASVFSNLSKILQDIPLLGGLFKGSTPHIPYDECVAKSNEVAGQFIRLYDALDEAGKLLFYQKAKEFYSYVLRDFGSWWGGVIQQDYDSWESKGWLTDNRTATYHYLAQPVFYFMRFEDATRVETLFASRYTQKMNNILWVSLSTYTQQTYGKTLDQFKAQVMPSETPGSLPSQAGILGINSQLIIYLVIAGVVAIVFFKKR